MSARIFKCCSCFSILRKLLSIWARDAWQVPHSVSVSNRLQLSIVSEESAVFRSCAYHFWPCRTPTFWLSSVLSTIKGQWWQISWGIKSDGLLRNCTISIVFIDDFGTFRCLKRLFAWVWFQIVHLQSLGWSAQFVTAFWKFSTSWLSQPIFAYWLCLRSSRLSFD